MATRIPIILGVLLGLAVSAGVLYFRGSRRPDPIPATGPIISECDGALRRLVIHYADASDDVVIPTYRAFLRQLPGAVEVYVVCPSREVFQALVDRVGPTECTLTPVIVDHPITSWSRDRWLALSAGSETTLLCPRGEDGADVWPARKGDQQVAFDLAKMFPGLRAQRSDLDFDGGDFAADTETVFVRPSVVLRNLHHTVASRDELIVALTTILKRRVVILEGAPDHHVGMYLMPVGNRTVLVGDPRLAEKLLADAPDEAAAVRSFLPGGPDFSAGTLASFDGVARQCAEAGYRVVRIPVVPGTDGRTFLTFVNGIQDERDGSRTIYMPAYSFAKALNRAARAVWTELGYEVREVECDACARNFGTLHCVVNVLERD